MKKLSFTNVFQILILILSSYFLYILTIISIDLKNISKNSDNGRYLPFGDIVLDSKTGKSYISIGSELRDIK